MFSNDGKNIIGSFSDEDIYSFKTRDSAEKPEYDKRYQGHCNSQTGKLKDKSNRNSNWEFIKLLKKICLHFILQKLSNSELDFHFSPSIRWQTLIRYFI